jgi:hypothetical protein
MGTRECVPVFIHPDVVKDYAVGEGTLGRVAAPANKFRG